MMETPGDAQGFGGFVLGALRLALPMTALREVVPFRDLLSLPCPSNAVLAGIDLRGVAVPVVDLRRLLEQPLADAAHPVVVVMVHDGRLLGLLADAVTGVFTPVPGSLHLAGTREGEPSLLAGSLKRADDGTLVTLLAPEALSCLTGVPMVDDPEASRLAATLAEAVTAGTALKDRTRQLVHLRCGPIAMAIDAAAVDTTVSNPTLEPSALAMGDCRGIFHHAGADVAAVDLLALSGLGKLDLTAGMQALLVSLEVGRVALLVSEVIDVTRTTGDDWLPLPAFALAQHGLFAGALDASMLAPTARKTGHDSASGQVLLLCNEHLKTSPALLGLAQATHPVGNDNRTGAAVKTTRAAQRAMVTFDIFGETAAPIEQIIEILPYAADEAPFEDRGALRGLVVNRGRSIPLVCLRQLMSGQHTAWDRDTSILVVESGGEWLGLAVPRLHSIEAAEWEPVLPTRDRGRLDAVAHVLRSGQLALVGAGATRRMLRVLNLLDLAQALRSQAQAQPA